MKEPGKIVKTPRTPGFGASSLAAALFVGAFAVIAVLVASGLTQNLDVLVLLWIDAALPDSLYPAMIFFTTIGYYQYCAIAVVLAAILFYLPGWRTSSVVILTSTLGGMAVTTLLKYLFGRERPDFIDSGYTAGYFSFPSGHATMAVGFYLVLAAIIFLHLRGIVGWVVLLAGVIIAFMIGLSRMYLGVHYPTDILAGFLVSPTLVAVFFALRAAIVIGRKKEDL